MNNVIGAFFCLFILVAIDALLGVALHAAKLCAF